MSGILVLNGSPRRKGTTSWMISALLDTLEGEKEIIPAYTSGVSPCIDCRSCWKTRGCAITDGMQEIYRKIDAADVVIFASPIYFHSVTGPLKILIDRLQVYWASRLRKDRALDRRKVGAVLMCGGSPAFPRQFDGGEVVLRNVLKDLNAEWAGMAVLPDTDRDPHGDEIGFSGEIMRLGEAVRTLMVKVF
jgi:putative NADPH-quinone reductase